MRISTCPIGAMKTALVKCQRRRVQYAAISNPMPPMNAAFSSRLAAVGLGGTKVVASSMRPHTINNMPVNANAPEGRRCLTVSGKGGDELDSVGA